MNESLRKKLDQPKVKKGSVWAGPEKEGITYSLLCRFLNCRERFRALVIEGLKPVEQFNHRIEFGQMWHICEEAFAAGKNWDIPLQDYLKYLQLKYPTDREQSYHWYCVVKTQFPIYIKYWSKHPDVLKRTGLLQEQIFNVPYVLPSGRVVRLRGKWDSVDLIGG